MLLTLREIYFNYTLIEQAKQQFVTKSSAIGHELELKIVTNVFKTPAIENWIYNN